MIQLTWQLALEMCLKVMRKEQLEKLLIALDSCDPRICFHVNWNIDLDNPRMHYKEGKIYPDQVCPLVFPEWKSDWTIEEVNKHLGKLSYRVGDSQVIDVFHKWMWKQRTNVARRLILAEVKRELQSR